MLTINHQFDTITASSGVISFNTNSGGLILPTGGSSNRPAAIPANAGEIRYNSDASAIELSNGTTWTSFSGGVAGPVSSTANTIPRFADTSGLVLGNSPVGLDVLGNITNVNSIAGASLVFTTGQINGTLNVTTGNVGTLTFGVGTATNLTATNIAVTGLVASNISVGTNISVGNTLQSVTIIATGAMTAPTRTIGDNSTNVATTAYVDRVGNNSQGVKTVSSAAPSGGNNGDLWYQV